jgi:hypothetical protein
LRGLRCEVRAVGFVGHAARIGHGFAAGSCDGLCRLRRLAQVDDGNAVAAACEQLCGAAADALRSSGDDGYVSALAHGNAFAVYVPKSGGVMA